MTSIDELSSKGLVPRITAELAGDGAARRVSGRGAVRVSNIQPASAVVIGLGGSGIQIASRLQAAIDGDRPEQHGESAVQIIGIDAVDEDNQSEPLPPGVRLRSGSLLNLSGFDPSDYLEHNLGSDPALSSWWDADYRVPEGSLTKGLRRERMLGRLCFYVNRPAVQTKIRKAMVDAMAITGGRPAGGSTSIDVYVIGSSVGGTGSSAMLETLAAVHAAAHELGGLRPKIRALVLLPGVFAGVGGVEAPVLQAQRANAFAYFKELDYFLINGEKMAQAMNWPGLQIDKDGLLHQVFLFDSSMGNAGKVARARDIYEIAAESLYQFLLTESGQRLIGVAGVNREIYLGSLDAFDKPRRYCGLGLSRIVFPGDTMRSHLTMYWCHQMLQHGFGRPAVAGELDPLTKEKLSRLEDAVMSLSQRASTPGENRDRTVLQDQGTRAPSNLKSRPESEYAGEIVDELRSSLPRVQADMYRVLDEMRPHLVEEAQRSVESAAFSSGESVPQALDFLQDFQRRLRRRLEGVAAEVRGAQSQLDSAQTALNQHRQTLEVAEGRGLFEALAGSVLGLFGGGAVSRADAGEAFGNAIRDWVSAALRLPMAEARLKYLEAIEAHLKRCIGELQRADEQLVGMKDRASSAYKRDELLGKDAGPEATTALIPDVLPEVEFSALSRSLTAAIQAEHGGRLQGDEIQAFIERWQAESKSRGFFDLGSENPTDARIAEDSLLALLERDAERVAVADRLPENLVSAAEASGGLGHLEAAIASLLLVSDNVCWNFAPGRFRPTPLAEGVAGGSVPEVSTAISHHASLAPFLEGKSDGLVTFEDPERVVALSCQWAVPLHCLPVVSGWKVDYERLRAQREVDRTRPNRTNIEPPNHVSKHFERLADPIPEYFVIDNTADVAVAGLVMAAIVREAASGGSPDLAEAVKRVFVADATISPTSPIRRNVAAKQWVVRPCSIISHRVKPNDEITDVVLGEGYSDLLKGLGSNVGLAASVRAVWEVFLKAVGSTRIVGLIESNLLGESGRLTRDEREADVEERRYVQLLINAATRLRGDLEFD